mmetsp:Transcript_42339/g.66303  ORF Transcript_42339/g.66303 Transcript_42339/m.66303 type:complete len:271 (-) Transcript_42339:231-1043(-)
MFSEKLPKENSHIVKKKYSSIKNRKFSLQKGGSKLIVEKHTHPGVFIVRGREDALCTKNLCIGQSVYGEKRIQVLKNNVNLIEEYRIWNPFRSKLAAAVLGGIDDLFLRPGMKVLYLGAANGTTVSHVSDILGKHGVVFAVEFSNRSGRDLLSMSQERNNIIPIIEDARYPQKYRVFMTMVDLIFSDVAQPDQTRILALNARYFLKTGGHFIITIKATCIDSVVDPNIIFTKEVQKLQKEDFRPIEQITLEPYERNHAMVLGKYYPKNWE